MRKHLYVDGTDLANYGVYVSGQGTFGAPEKEVTTYAVPGRNGLVLGVNERMENIEVTYPCFIYANFEQNMRDLRSFLLSRSGYVKINDDYDTTHFRMGFFEAGIDPNVTSKNNAARFDLTFNCQPQRWLTSGETVVTITTNSTPITNPTLFNSHPFLRLYLTGSVWFYIICHDGSTNKPLYSVTISDITADGYSYIDLDCETMNAYNGSDNLASYVDISETHEDGTVTQYIGDFPAFTPGANLVSFPQGVGNLTKLELTPRWWEV